MTLSNSCITELTAATSVRCTEPRKAVMTWSTSVAGLVRVSGTTAPEAIIGPEPGSAISMNFLPRSVRRRTDAEMPWESLPPLLIWSAMRMECGWRWMELTLPTSRPATRTGSPGATSLASLKTAFTV